MLAPRGSTRLPVSVFILCHSTMPTHYHHHVSHQKELVQRREKENMKITDTRPNKKSVLGMGRKPPFIE